MTFGWPTTIGATGRTSSGSPTSALPAAVSR